MHRSNPFARAIAMMAALSAAMQATAGNFALQQSKIAEIGPYQSHGKRKTRAHDAGGTRAYQRAAQKKRNQQRHRRACRG